MADPFYVSVLSSLGIAAQDTVLAVCAGKADRDALVAAGVSGAVISNLSPIDAPDSFAPFAWRYVDAERIDAGDKSFDYVVVKAGLHHCASPHAPLCEMLRVARKGVAVIEARDSLLIRLAVRLGLTVEYELEPVFLSSGQHGGWRNTHVPNFIYRWTEREVEKTVRSMLPHRQPQFRFFYGYLVPLQRMRMSRNMLKRATAHAGAVIVPILQSVIPRQGNRFGFTIRTDGPIQPWLMPTADGLAFDMTYLSKTCDAVRYRR